MFLEWDITSFLRQHKPQKYMHALCGHKLLILREFTGGISIQVPFKTGSTVIVHQKYNNVLIPEFTGGISIQVPFKTGSIVIVYHQNNNVLIPSYSQLTSISWRILLFTYIFKILLSVCNIKLHKYVLYNICMFLLINKSLSS